MDCLQGHFWVVLQMDTDDLIMIRFSTVVFALEFYSDVYD